MYGAWAYCMRCNLPSAGMDMMRCRMSVQVVIMADGQVTRDAEVVKPNVRKTRRIGENVIGGFAGRSAIALVVLCVMPHSRQAEEAP